MKRLRFTAATMLACCASLASAQQYSVQALNEQPPADALSPEIIQAIQPSGLRVLKGARTVVDLWLAKQWPARPGFQPSTSVMYPLEIGALVGVARYKNRGGDFRNQEIPSGVYTVRYGQQPEDGNHIGTSDTRDFLLLIPAAADREAAQLPVPKLFQASAKAAGTTHPTMLSLLRSGEGSVPAVQHDEERELVSVRIQGQAKAGDKTSPLVMTVVVVGHAAE